MTFSCDASGFVEILICANNFMGGILGFLFVILMWFVTFSRVKGQDGDMSSATYVAFGTSLLLYLLGAVSGYVVLMFLVLLPIVVMITRK